MLNINNDEENKGDEHISNIICTICPNSCQLSVYKDKNGNIQVLNALCKRGIKYGKQEFVMPMRMLITTMKIYKGVLPVLPVRSNEEIPKERIFDAIEVVNQTFVQSPIKMGDCIIENLLGLGVNVIASRSMETKKK
ncbi:MAG: DUF1667 domain-containing protein [Promethearchaeota archaeon]